MIALDTNVLVRLLAQDDPNQSKAVEDLINGLSEEEPGFICREAIVELVWVLERAYKLGRAQIVPAIEGLLSSRELIVEEAERVGEALALYAAGKPGFSDQMILAAARASESKVLVTFDQSLAKSDGAQLLK